MGRAALGQTAAPPSTATAVPSNTSAAAGGEPTLPDVSDPLLAPAPPPQHVLQSWQQALTLVRTDSASYHNARLAIEQAQAAARIALAPSLPQLRGTAILTHHLLEGQLDVPATAGPPPTPAFTQAIPNPSTSFQAALALTVPLFHPKDWYDHGTAKDNIEATRLTSRDAERLIVATVANAIVAVVTNERLAEVSRSSLKAALSTLDLTKRRAALGAATALDVLRAEQDSSLSRSDVVTATERLIEAREALGTSLGSAEAWGVTPDIHIDALSADAQNNCKTETDLLARSDVRAATASVGVADRGVKSVDYAFLPTVDATSQLTYYDPNSAINNRNLTWTIGGLLTWQIYDGSLRYGQQDAARAQAGLAREQLRETKRRASLEVTQALRAVQVAEANLTVSSRTREIAAETARLARISYMNGSGTSFDLVNTAQQLRAAEIDLAVKEFEVLRSKIAALLAMSTCSV
ncbi:MAG TPA: TolC family protein [Polyangiaceae bacterium]